MKTLLENGMVYYKREIINHTIFLYDFSRELNENEIVELITIINDVTHMKICFL